MRRAAALGLTLAVVACASAGAKISTKGGERLAEGTAPSSLPFRFTAVAFGETPRVVCVALQRRLRFGPRHGWVGEHHCEDPPASAGWQIHASWGGHCETRGASVVGFVRAPAVRVTWFDGQSAAGSVFAVPERYARASSVFSANAALRAPVGLAAARDYSLFFAQAAVRTAPRLVEALDASGAVVAQVRYPRRERRWVCRRFDGFYLGGRRSG